MKGKVTTDMIEIKRITTKYYKQSYGNKLNCLDETDKFLQTYNLPKLNQEKTKKAEQTDYKKQNHSYNKKKTPNKEKFQTRWFHR